MPDQRTTSELLFEQYLTEQGYDFDSQPKIPGKTTKLDVRVRFDGMEIFFELKEFEAGGKLADGAFDPYRRIYQKLRDCWKQINEHREYSCSLVLYNGGAEPVYLVPEFVLGAMLGTMTWITDKSGRVMGQVLSEPGGFKTGFMFDFNKETPRNTQFSAIIVLEVFPLGQIKLSPLLDERKKSRERDSSGVENAIDTYQYIERLKSEGFDIDETALRVIVYENPFATKRLTRLIFQGPYDERWGSIEPGKIESVIIVLMRLMDNWLTRRHMTRLFWFFLRFSKSGKIVKVYEGPKLKELEPALRSYRRPALVKAGILKEK